MRRSHVAEQFQCRCSALPDGHLIVVSGEVDMATAPSLAEALDQFVSGTVTVDLSDVTFIDSTGLKALVAAHRRIERRRSRLIVRGVAPIVRRLFEIAGLDALLHADPIDDDEPPGLHAT